MLCSPSGNGATSDVLNDAEELELYRLLEEEAAHAAGRLLYSLYPDHGPLRRDLYPKHLEHFTQGREHQERAIIAGNRTGKSMCCGFELVCHMIGDYPPWWPGRRFSEPDTWWAVGEDAKTVRDSVQKTLFGEFDALGTGLIPGANIIGKPTSRGGVPEAFDSASIRHKTGGISRLILKSYDQKREAFQATKIAGGWLDEEPPMPVYTETLTRTMATVPGEQNGILECSFTPLKGMSDVVLLYLPGGKVASQRAVAA